MKHPTLTVLLSLLAAAQITALRAAPLAETTAVQSRPDAAAPVIGTLKAGTEPVAPAAAPAATPDGWMAVTVPGPFEAYVLNRDLTKGLDVKAGSKLYLQPEETGAVLTTMSKGDKVEITGLHGRWTQVRLAKDLVGYIPAGQATPAAINGPAAAPAVPAPVPVAAGPGRPAPGFAPGDNDADLFPRLLEGRFVSTSNFLPFHKPYAWQLVDESGTRRAYLDVSKLLQTDQIDRYVNRDVEVSGTLTALPDGRDVVVSVQSMSLR